MKRSLILLGILLLWAAPGLAQTVTAVRVVESDAFFRTPDPRAPVWEKAEVTTIQLLPQNITAPSIAEPSVAQLRVQALHNGKWLGVRLEWKDPARDVHVSNDFASDACAIQFPLGAGEQTSPFMGNKGAAVAILHWKAIWQQDIDDHYQTVKDLHPRVYSDTDRFGKSVAIDAKNPVAQLKRTVPVEELIAEGFGTLTTQRRQNALGRGVWHDGTWSVVLMRPLKSSDTQDPALRAGVPVSIAFAIWEGGHKNVGARKNYAPWVTMQWGK